MHARVFEGGERIGLRSVTSSRSGLHRAARLLATERVGDAVHKHQDTARSKHATHSKQQRRCVSPCATATHSASSGRLSVAHTLQRATDLRYPVPIFACGRYPRNGKGYVPIIRQDPIASRGVDVETQDMIAPSLLSHTQAPGRDESKQARDSKHASMRGERV